MRPYLLSLLALTILAGAMHVRPAPVARPETPGDAERPAVVVEPLFDRTRDPGRSRVSGVLGLQALRAYRALANATALDEGTIGFGGAISPNAGAFRILLADQHAEAAFEELVRIGTITGQLYGLEGLSLTNRSAFLLHSGRYRGSKDMVRSYGGCLMVEVRVVDAMSRIAKRREPEHIAAAVPPNPSLQRTRFARR